MSNITKGMKYIICIFVALKNLIYILVVLTIALRPVLPLVNYAVNYDYIVKNLCENRARPQLMCNGKCYLAKELSKTEKQQSQQNKTVKISMIDAFIPKEIISFTNFQNKYYISDVNFSEYQIHYHSHYFTDIFHPPLV